MQGKRWLSGVLLFLAAALAISSALYIRRSTERIELGKAGMAMPGLGPSHASYLPAAPRGNLREIWGTRMESETVGPCAVAGDRVFAACRGGFLYCLELDSGRPLWRYDAKGEITSMPSLSEEGVMFSTEDGRVVCVDAEGRFRWEAEVGGAVPSSPLPAGKEVYFASRDGFLYCVDATDGSKRWSFQADAPLEVSPCLYEDQVLCASYEGTLFALDARDGRLLWSSRLQGVPVSFPVADEGRVFMATDIELHCADVQSGKTLWSCALGPTVLSNPAVRGNQVVILQGEVDEVSALLSLDVRTGDQLWRASTGIPSCRTNLLVTNRDVYLAGPGQLLVLEWETGSPTLKVNMEGVVPATLAVTEDRVLMGTTRRKVFCLGE